MSSYVTVSIVVDGTARRLAPIMEQVLGLTVGTLPVCRELSIQLDPEVSSSASVRLGGATLGTTVTQTTPSASPVQKGVTLSATQIGYTARCGDVNGIPVQSLYGQTVTGTAVLNVTMWGL